MQILKATASDVLASIGKVAGIVPSRSTMPIVSNILISKAGDTHKFIGSDVDIQIESSSSLGGDEGRIATTVQAAKLLSLLKSLPADQVVTLATDGAKLALKAGRSKFTLQTMDAANFPQFREDPTTSHFEVTEGTLAALIDQTQHAMDERNPKPFFNGMNMEWTAVGLTVVSSNGYCMAVGRKAVDKSGEAAAIIPRKAVLELRKLLGASDSPVSIRLGLNHARFAFGSMVFLTKIIGAKFPDYARVLSMAPEGTSATVNRVALLAMLRRALLVTKEDQKSPGVKFKFAPGVLTLLAQSNAEDGTQEVDLQYDGPEFMLGLPILQVIDGLTGFADDLVRLSFAPDKPLLMTYDSEQHFKFLIMPMRI
jgi:DNA polymerase III subunit beta